MEMPPTFRKVVEQYVQQHKEEQSVNKNYTKDEILDKKKELDHQFNSELIFNQFGLHANDPLNLSDKDRSEFIAKLSMVSMKKSWCNDQLRTLKNDEEYKQAKVDTIQYKSQFKTPFKSIQNVIQNAFDTHISKFISIAEQKQQNQQYQIAISFYSRAVFNLNDWFKAMKPHIMKGNDIEANKFKSYFFTVAIHKQICDILSKRAECYLQLRKYDKSLRDYNKIISLCAVSTDIIEEQKTMNYIEMTHNLQNANWNRGELWLKIGNSANCISDFKYLCAGFTGLDDEDEEIAKRAYHKLIELVNDKGINKHPSQNSIAHCNKFTMKLNKFSKNGWTKLFPNNLNMKLPQKHGHIMIEYGESIYVFGGTRVVYGAYAFSSYMQRKMDQKLFFLKININVDTKTYTFQKLKFPIKMRRFLVGTDEPIVIELKRMLTGCKWKNKMIIIGGENQPFKNVLMYNFDTQNWKCLNAYVPKYLKKCNKLTNHASIVMNDILYVFGGKYNEKETNMLCCLNLVTKKWNILTAYNSTNVIHGKHIPGSRFDHIIWKNDKNGLNGCIYIGYGNHFRKGNDNEIQRCDIWRFDVYESKWYKEQKYGNYPSSRGECAYTGTDNGIMVFGGYSSVLLHPNMSKKVVLNYAFFGDCFEYIPKGRKWIMIQTNNYPLHRAYNGLCVLQSKNVLCLYGGYHGGQPHESCVYDDIWILDLNKLKENISKIKYLKICGNMKCSVTVNDSKLYKCKGINSQTTIYCDAMYCSKYCQKRDWIKHRKFCHRV